VSSGIIIGDFYIVKRTEFLVIAKEDALLSLAKEVAEFFTFKATYASGHELLEAENENRNSPTVTLMSLMSFENIESKVEAVRHVRGLYPRTQIMIIVNGGETLTDRELLQMAGVQRFILHQEIKNSGKFYYLCSLMVQGTYIPVPVTDLFPSTRVNFNGYHKLIINQKFLPVIFAGFDFSDKKYRRLEPAKQIYVRREDLNEYRKYIETYHDRTGSALKKRCRAMMMSLMALYTELILLLTLDSESSKEELLKARLAEFMKMATDLGEYLKDCPDVWNVIAQSLDFQFCRHERGPYILAYALYIALKIEMRTTPEIILAILLADIGLLDLPAQAYKQVLKKSENQLVGNELESYKNHPMGSLNRAMMKQLDLSNDLKSILVCTHERNDEQGFPNQVPKDKIPVEAQLIQFSEILDCRVRASLEDGIVTHDFVRKQVWEEERDSLKRFNADFLDKIAKVLIA
jgi:hypothetical protein